MRFRRRNSDEGAATPEVGADVAEAAPAEEQPATGGTAGDLRADGPWDSSEVEVDLEDGTRIDLGGLIVTGRPGLELQLQVDEATGSVAAVVLAGEEGAVELRAFAAPRNGDVWTDIRRSIAAEVAQHGGTADEAEGMWGTELRVMMPVQFEDGQQATQPSRVLGIPGPRWLLRATLFGEPALNPVEDGEVESALRDVVVVRGTSPMSPGEPLPMRVPPNAQRIEPEA